MDSIKLATKCPHPDKPEKAKGMCQSCYRAARKAEEVGSGKVKLDEETGVEVKTGEPVEMDFVNDPQAVKEFYRIMWGWLQEAQKAQQPIITLVKGKPVRDFKLETRMQEVSLVRSTKAATILGRAYIAERHVEEKPAELPVDGMSNMISGWVAVEQIGKGKKLDA